ncbi:uncharacterized oxidoreductase YoxD-like [Culicoides brevitarsis]|uniref:uncharacterized oxidoreductase YoxD-like n=1 Tax=Culicoides brevitarsis TaxID=469753 RepID=UPI00307BCCF9
MEEEFSELRWFYHLLRSLVVSIFLGIRQLFQRLTMKRKDIKGQLALVTGGGNGLGREICLGLAREGCNIAIVDIDEKSSMETVEDLRGLGVKAEYYNCDVSDSDAVEELKSKVVKKSGTVDILVNNAGILFSRPVIEETTANIKKMVGINLMSNFWMTRAFLPSMVKKRRGHIVSIGSMASYFPNPADTIYTTTKFGVRGFMEAISQDLYIQGLNKEIITTAVFPYFMSTSNKIGSHVKDICRHSFMLTPTEVANEVIQAICYNKQAIMIPRGFETLFYVNFPRFFWHEYLRTTFKIDDSLKWKLPEDTA